MDTLGAAILSSVWLGILTSISPCPLATNIVAVSFIGRRLRSSRLVLWTGLAYAAGRTLTYVLLAALLISSIFASGGLSFWLQMNMNRLLGPVLILVGLFLLDVIPLGIPSFFRSEKLENRLAGGGLLGAGLLGMLFALSFCPVSAALFFGSLIPLSIAHSSKFLMPALYGIGTAIPVCIFAVLLAGGAQRAAQAFHRVAEFEKWTRRVTAAVFILIGCYFCWAYLLPSFNG